MILLHASMLILMRALGYCTTHGPTGTVLALQFSQQLCSYHDRISEIKKGGLAMGEWRPRHPLPPREPIDLIVDPSYGRSNECDAQAVASGIDDKGMAVEIRLDAGTVVKAGQVAFVTCKKGGTPKVWVDGPYRRCIGELHGLGAKLLAHQIQTHHAGLLGFIDLDRAATSEHYCVRLPDLESSV
jgi:hypothetical protein